MKYIIARLYQFIFGGIVVGSIITLIYKAWLSNPYPIYALGGIILFIVSVFAYAAADVVVDETKASSKKSIKYTPGSGPK